MFRTVLCDMLEIRYPILMGAMQGAGKPRLVAAVSEAGGLGVLPTFGETEADLLRQIRETRALTDRPFGVNITPVGRAFTEKRAAICIEQNIPVVTTGLGDPGPDAVAAMRSHGIKVIPVVPTGGIGDGRGFLAVLSLGAVGAQLGTRLICTPEAEDAGWYKQAILAASEEGTVITKSLTGKTTRAFATPEVRAYEEARLGGLSGAALKPYERAVRQGRKKGADYEGSRQAVVGQICGMLKDESDIKPVAQVIEEIIRDAADRARHIAALL